tara:strand:+ start:353 stop:478 length:126 start_codon:yes stop_codon:yes gene_type:complete
VVDGEDEVGESEETSGWRLIGGAIDHRRPTDTQRQPEALLG